MATREELRRKARDVVPEAELDDVIARAQELQDEAGGRDGVTREELEAVAKELDIDPEHLDRALDERRRGREYEDRAEGTRDRRAEIEQRRKKRKRNGILATVAGLALAGVGFLLSLFLG